MTKIAAIQFSGNVDKEANVKKAAEMVTEAARNGARIVCLQELFNTMYFCTEQKFEYFELAETVPGPTINRMSELASQFGIVLIAPIFEKVIEGEYYNSAIIIGPKGEIMGTYRKSHIPCTYVKEYGTTFYEHFYFKPGNTGFQVFTTPFGVNIGVIICADVHYPEGPRVLALKGTHIIFVPNAAGSKQSKSRWEVELRAYAMHNICYVAGVNRVGFDEGGYAKSWYGSSVIVGPDGEIMTKAGDEKDEIIYADLDVELITDLRNRFGYYRERRTDLYGQIVE